VIFERVFARAFGEYFVSSAISGSDSGESALRYESHGHVVTMTLNLPERRNALGRKLVSALREGLSRFHEDRGAWVGIITGAGRAFCAGGDLEDMKSFIGGGAGDWAESIGYIQQLFEQIDAVQKPLIAAVNGYCMGGGLGLANACQLIVAGESAIFGMPEAGVGVPNYSYFDLWKSIGARRLFEMSLTAESFSARRALEIGLVNRVVPDKDTLLVATQIAERIAQNSPLAVVGANRAIKFTFHHSREQWPAAAREIWHPVLASDDLLEGLKAFQERRKPRWTNG
jgi:E-phenylitaconyl-CoA hydratase